MPLVLYASGLDALCFEYSVPRGVSPWTVILGEEERCGRRRRRTWDVIPIIYTRAIMEFHIRWNNACRGETLPSDGSAMIDADFRRSHSAARKFENSFKIYPAHGCFARFVNEFGGIWYSYVSKQLRCIRCWFSMRNALFVTVLTESRTLK